MLRIGVVTHYKKMSENFSHLAIKENCELLFEVGVMDYAIAIGIRMEETLGVDAIIAPSITGAIIQKHVNIPIIPLHVRNYSFLEAFHRARNLGERIAFADISHDLSDGDFQQIRTILNYDVQRYPFDNLDQVASVVAKAKDDGRTVIVSTASCMYRQGKKSNMNVVLIEPTEQDMVAAIGIARTFAVLKHKDKERMRWLKTVMDSPAEGILTIDADGTLTVANALARETLGLGGGELVGRNIAEVRMKSALLDEVFTTSDRYVVSDSGQRQVIVSKEDIFADAEFLGSVVRINRLDDIRRMEMDARKKARDNGLVARFTFDDIIGDSPEMDQVKERAKRFARTRSNILLNGESGCGKEMFAQSIHNHSDCGQGPFVAVNCATLPEQLLESELFGYETGAFTGAKKGGNAGLFELAHGGTIFLDEIGDMPMPLQAKLLRVLQERMVRRLGGGRNVPVNVRVIAATNRNLRSAIRDGSFREDLYYRLNVLSCEIPPLRKRRGDIRPLIRHFEESMRSQESGACSLSHNDVALLETYEWPGNVRELRNFVERITALADDADPAISHSEIEELFQQHALISRPPPAAMEEAEGNGEETLVLPVGTMRDMESEIFRELYRRFNGNKKRLEQTLELSTTTVWRKLRENAIEE